MDFHPPAPVALTMMFNAPGARRQPQRATATAARAEISRMTIESRTMDAADLAEKRNLKKGGPYRVKKRWQGDMGWGLMADTCLPCHHNLGPYGGERMTLEQKLAFEAANPGYDKFLLESPGFWVTGEGGSDVCFINYACHHEANAVWAFEEADETGRVRISVETVVYVPPKTFLSLYYGFKWNRKRDIGDPSMYWLRDYRCSICYPDTPHHNALFARRCKMPDVVAQPMSSDSEDDKDDAEVGERAVMNPRHAVQFRGAGQGQSSSSSGLGASVKKAAAGGGGGAQVARRAAADGSRGSVAAMMGAAALVAAESAGKAAASSAAAAAAAAHGPWRPQPPIPVTSSR